MAARFAWNERKDAENQRKHGVSFALAREAFLDPARVIARIYLPAPDHPDHRGRLPAAGQAHL